MHNLEVALVGLSQMSGGVRMPLALVYGAFRVPPSPLDRSPPRLRTKEFIGHNAWRWAPALAHMLSELHVRVMDKLPFPMECCCRSRRFKLASSVPPGWATMCPMMWSCRVRLAMVRIVPTCCERACAWCGIGVVWARWGSGGPK